MSLRHWTDIGNPSVELLGGQPRISEAIDRIAWHPVRTPAPFSQGYAIRAAIQHFRMRRVIQWGDANALAPYGLLGIEATYQNGRVRLYLLDSGSDAVPLCTDVFPEGAPDEIPGPPPVDPHPGARP